MSHASRSTTSGSGSTKRYKKFCKFCCDSGKSEEVFTSHFLRESKNVDAKIVCPTLLAMECRYCHENGHTVRYCPKLVARATPTPELSSTDEDTWTLSSSRSRKTKNHHQHKKTTPRVVFDDVDEKTQSKSYVSTSVSASASAPMKCANMFAVLAEYDVPTSTERTNFPSLTHTSPSFSTHTRVTKLGVWSKPLTISTTPTKTMTKKTTTKKTMSKKTTTKKTTTKKTMSKKKVTFKKSPSISPEEQIAQMKAIIHQQQQQLENLRKENEVIFMDTHCPIQSMSTLTGDRKKNMETIFAGKGLIAVEPEHEPSSNTQIQMSWGDMSDSDDEELWGDMCM